MDSEKTREELIAERDAWKTKAELKEHYWNLHAESLFEEKMRRLGIAQAKIDEQSRAKIEKLADDVQHWRNRYHIVRKMLRKENGNG